MTQNSQHYFVTPTHKTPSSVDAAGGKHSSSSSSLVGGKLAMGIPDCRYRVILRDAKVANTVRFDIVSGSYLGYVKQGGASFDIFSGM